MKKIISKIALVAILVMPLGLALTAGATTSPPNWNVVGTYVWSKTVTSGTYVSDMVITTENPDGTFTGTGGYPAGSAPYTAPSQTAETITGQVTGNNITFTTTNLGPYYPGNVTTLTGTIADNGSMSGTSPTWQTTSGNAVALGSLAAQDFGVMNQSGVMGYTAGFGLTNTTLAQAQSIVVQLYSGTTLLQTNTATSQVFGLPGTDFSSPFDVFGTFNYVTDGYWTNVRGAEYGQTLIPTSVVATVTLSNGAVLTATNTTLTGDPSTIFPVVTNVTTNSATAITSSDATLNGTNGVNAATGHSFWASLNTFSTASPTLPANVYSTADLGAIASNTAFSALLSSVNGLATVTPSTTYYYAAWSNVGGTWYPGAVMSFTTSSATNTPPTNPTVTIDKYIDGVQATAANANSSSFPMTETYTIASATATSTYNLSPSGINTPNAYEAITSPLDANSNYMTNEVTGGSVVGTDCSSTQPFALVGYTSGSTMALAQAATPTTTPPSFTNLTNNEYVIVWNHNCSTISGTVTGGGSGVGVLAVTSITPVQTTATADNTYADGWSYLFNITVPTNEPNLSMDFGDWLNSSASSTLPAAGDMQISSAQANNNGAVIPITAANVYSTPALDMTGDLDSGTAGLQTQVLVQVKIPLNTVNGSYLTNYGVQTMP
jgi:hypothetical protein